MNYEGYLSVLATEDASADTITAYRSDLKHFDAFLKERGLRVTQVIRATVTEWKQQMASVANPRFGRVGLKPASIDRRIAVVSCFFDFLCANNSRMTNPFRIRIGRRRRGRKIQNHNGKALDDLSLDTLSNGIDNARDRALFSLFVTSGLRLSEVWQLDVATLQKLEEDREDGTTCIWGTGRVIGKGNKERVFYFDDLTVTFIDQYLASRADDIPALFISQRKQRLSKREIQDILATWCRKLGLQHFHIHQLRHTFATRLADAGIEALVLRDLLGHSNFATTLLYITANEHTQAQRYFSAMERIHLL